MSGFMGAGHQFDQPGLRAKFYGRDWNPAGHNIPLSPPEVLDAHRLHKTGHTLRREQFTEAAAVWNEEAWAKTGDLFMAGPFYAVKKKIADVLKNFDLGAGELVPFPIYAADLKTPVEGEYYFLNFGEHKDSFRPELSDHAYKHSMHAKAWSVLDKDNVVVDASALDGADLWMETRVLRQVFMNGELARALKSANPKATLVLRHCEVVEKGA